MNNKKINTLLRYLMMSTCIVMVFEPASAEIYKCVNKNNDTYYNDRPCPKNNDETKLRAVKDLKKGYSAPSRENKADDTRLSSGKVVKAVKGKSKRDQKTQSTQQEKLVVEKRGGGGKSKDSPSSNTSSQIAGTKTSSKNISGSSSSKGSSRKSVGTSEFVDPYTIKGRMY